MVKYKYFTVQEYTKGREKLVPLDAEQEENMHKLLTALDQFREAWGNPLRISSGYRTPEANAEAGGAKKSNHMKCAAVDFVDDKNQSLAKFCMDNIELLEKLGLYMEDPSYTKGKYTNWVHLQTVKTSKRIFKPY